MALLKVESGDVFLLHLHRQIHVLQVYLKILVDLTEGIYFVLYFFIKYRKVSVCFSVQFCKELFYQWDQHTSFWGSKKNDRLQHSLFIDKCKKVQSSRNRYILRRLIESETSHWLFISCISVTWVFTKAPPL